MIWQMLNDLRVDAGMAEAREVGAGGLAPLPPRVDYLAGAALPVTRISAACSVLPVA